MAFDDDDNEEPRWHDDQQVVFAAGAAAVVLIGLLVWAVVHTSHGSMTHDMVPQSEPSFATSSSHTTSKSKSSTTYSLPSVQTSQDNPALTHPPSSSAPDDAPGGETTTATPWTPSNPYPTTTPTNAGAI